MQYPHMFSSFSIMASVIPTFVTFLAVFITCSNASNHDQCSLSNVEVLSDLIDARINATVAARLEEFIASEEFNTAVREKS